MTMTTSDFREELHQLVRRHLDAEDTDVDVILDALTLQTDVVQTYVAEHGHRRRINDPPGRKSP